jgi:hypothetical protein
MVLTILPRINLLGFPDVGMHFPLRQCVSMYFAFAAGYYSQVVIAVAMEIVIPHVIQSSVTRLQRACRRSNGIHASTCWSRLENHEVVL